MENMSAPLPLLCNQKIQVYTLGHFKVLNGSQIICEKDKQNSREIKLLKTLLACGHVDNASFCIASLLWPRVSNASAKRSLISATGRLRELLNAKASLQIINGKLALDSQYVWTDAWVFDSHLQSNNLSNKQLINVLSLYQGEFLIGDDDIPNVDSMRQKLHRRYFESVTMVGSQLEQNKDWLNAVNLYKEAIAIDDVSENIYRALLRCYHQLGALEKVSKWMEQCETVLKAKLSISPSAVTSKLYKDIVDTTRCL